NANFICYYFYPTKKREEPTYETFVLLPLMSTGIRRTFFSRARSRAYFPVWKGEFSGARGICPPTQKGL
ncbi:hypothetical protein, partial [uncultured Dialister sp.]|uniref:hypothetical protein n=1 Tax=uncultured Dialister sp. TaxID=278064 RepID=UPI00265E10D5